MPYTNYQDAKSCVQSFKEFRGNSWHAETTDRGEYCVFSRQTLIGYADPRSKTFWINPRYYSVTTKRQTNTLRRQWENLGNAYTQIEGDL